MDIPFPLIQLQINKRLFVYSHNINLRDQRPADGVTRAQIDDGNWFYDMFQNIW